jgi:fimbrial chaperone protein
LPPPRYICYWRHLLAAKLRSSSEDAAAGSVEEMAGIIGQIRLRWPATTIVVRADSGFCRDDLLTWLEANDNNYICGLALRPVAAKANSKPCVSRRSEVVICLLKAVIISRIVKVSPALRRSQRDCKLIIRERYQQWSTSSCSSGCVSWNPVGRLLAWPLRVALIVAASLSLPCPKANAGALQISTTTLDVPAAQAATSLIVQNAGREPVDVQIRVLRWSQSSGTEQLVESQDVVASPPFATIEPGRSYTIRIVRSRAEPIQKELSYRLLIDEIPRNSTVTGLGVNFAVRYSIPVFFGGSHREPPALRLSATASPDRVNIVATNLGTKRVRLADITLVGPGDTKLVSQSGLLGYVLAGATMSWTFPTRLHGRTGDTIAISAKSDSGPINARIQPTPHP